jgi:hypothetical protein
MIMHNIALYPEKSTLSGTTLLFHTNEGGSLNEYPGCGIHFTAAMVPVAEQTFEPMHLEQK